MKKHIIIFLLLFLSIGAVFAQDYERNGSVYLDTENIEGPRNSIGLTYGLAPLDATLPHQNTIISGVYAIGNISIDYSHRVTERISLIANFGYSAAYSSSYNSDIEISDSIYILNFIPLVKFSWIKNEKVDLYSASGLGIGYIVDDGKPRIRSQYHVIPIGVTVGKKVYFKGELGLGAIGTIRLGIGVKL